MVLKKPYAFFVKHFKLIHLLLSVPLLYLLLKTGNIASFFTSYISNGYVTSVLNVAGTYISYLMYVAIVVVILVTIAIYFLMKQREKSTTFYLILIIFYIVLFALISVAYGALSTVEDATASAQTVRFYRDISYICYMPQWFFLIYTALRGIGFNLKQFNFDVDIRELELSDVDDEEIEVQFGKDAYKYKRKFRRFIREFKYYFLENKVVFYGFSGVIVISVATILYLNFNVYHKVYRETQNVSHNGLVFNVVDSELSNMDLGGRVIKKGTYYMAIAFNVKNNGLNDVVIDYQNFKLVYDKEYIMPTLDRGSFFSDMGIPYTRDMKVKAKSGGTYVFVYEVPAKALNKKMDLRILESLESTIAGITPIYKTVNLNYETITESKDIKEMELGKILELSGTRVGLSQVSFKNYSVVNSYMYDYRKCYGNICNDLKGLVTIDPIKYGANKALLVLEDNITLDSTTVYYQTRNSISGFIKDFFRVRYENDSGVHEEEIVNVTPSELSNNLVLVVPSETKNAKRLDVLIDLRGRVYVMNLKK